MILVVGIPASITAYILVQRSVDRMVQLHFDREASAANSILEIKLKLYEDVLYDLRGLLSGDSGFDRARFHKFYKSLDAQNRFPGMVALNFAAYVPGHRRRQFEEQMRGEKRIDGTTLANFAIRPPGERSEYFVIVYAAPSPSPWTEASLGLDLGNSPLARDPDKVAASLRAGRDSGKLTASAQPFLVRMSTQATQPHFLAMRLAVYAQEAPVNTVEQRRQSYLGSVGAVFDVEAFFGSIFATDLLKQVRCRLYDLGSASDNGTPLGPVIPDLLFDTGARPRTSGRGRSDAGEDDTLTYRERVRIADRLWEFEYVAPRAVMLGAPERALPPVVLVGGLVTTMLLFGLTYVLATAGMRAFAMADAITRDLRDSESGLADAQRIAHLGNWSLDTNDWTMTWSAETYRILGRQPGGAVDYALFLRCIHAEDRATADAAIRGAILSTQDAIIVHRTDAGDGGARWAQTLIKPASRNRLGQVLGIILDITESKQAENELKASHEQLQALSRRLVDIQEGDRRQFSAELHDLVGQNLTALGINMNIMQRQLSAENNAAIGARLSDSVQLLRATSDAIDNVMSELRPQMLDDFGLLPAVQWYAGEFSTRTGIAADVLGDDAIPRLAQATEIAAFRVTQEALNNVAKHAQASSVQIHIAREGGHCVMSVRDNGRGFGASPATQGRRRAGLGMAIMRERVQAVGGTLGVESVPGRGTRVEWRMPF